MSATDDLRAHAKAALGAPIQRATHPTPCPRCPVRAELETERDGLKREVEWLESALRDIHNAAVTHDYDRISGMASHAINLYGRHLRKAAEVSGAGD